MFLAKLRWLFSGRPYKRYTGYHCGICGAWTAAPFSIPTYASLGWWDTWGLCRPSCKTLSYKGEI